MKINKKSIIKSHQIVEIILFVGSFFMVFPFIWMILMSFKPPEEIMQVPPSILPKKPTFDNYIRVWNEINFSVYFRNSLFVSIMVVSFQMYSSSLIGYVLAKIPFKGSKIIFYIILSCMMVPWPVTIIPLYQEMVWFKWVDSFFSLIVPFSVTVFGIFMIKQFAESIPDELIEAARIDGASEFRLFHTIILPLLKSAISALIIIQFLWIWDEFLWPYLMMTSTNKLTLPVGLSLFNGQWYVDYAGSITGACIAIIPVMTVYLIFQNQFIEGIAFDGVKG